MKKLLIIFSVLTLSTCISTIFGIHEKFCSPFKQCLGQDPNESDAKMNLQSHIERDTKKIITQLNNNNFNLRTPLPFTLCTKFAPFDIAKSSKNRVLFEHILNHPNFYIYDFADQSDNSNLFHVAAENGSTHIMSALFKHCQEKNIDCLPLINVINTKGKTPLGLAAACCRTKCLKMLLAHGAQHDARYIPLLHIAASTNTRGAKKRDNTVRVICELEFTIYEKDQQGRNAQDLAKLCTYESTAACIKMYEKKIYDKIEKMRQDARLNNYFKLLPLQIWEQTIACLHGPEDAIVANDQSQFVAS